MNFIDLNALVQLVQKWFVERDLHKQDGIGQLAKLQEEVQELLDAREDKNISEEIDAIGDITVVLIGYCMQRGLSFTSCLDAAYQEIKDRKGKLIDGVFVKEADLNSDLDAKYSKYINEGD